MTITLASDTVTFVDGYVINTHGTRQEGGKTVCRVTVYDPELDPECRGLEHPDPVIVTCDVLVPTGVESFDASAFREAVEIAVQEATT